MTDGNVFELSYVIKYVVIQFCDRNEYDAKENLESLSHFQSRECD